ncbi:hypothetical protein AK812_SmicGene8043 [Symbiodinium microadriaticum]|uniref:Uncharacterized protein n=1 Tax=Symbiodinium microadriaticum TaxID=2951 RepID=A0A1Q9ELV4_SYMMI|nr:hypothetical protein AK812_SmicGene8043 [Symbiodinium microadriaticum]
MYSFGAVEGIVFKDSGQDPAGKEPGAELAHVRMRKEVKFNRVLVDGPGLTVSSKHVDHEFKNAHSADKWLFEIYSDHQELLVQGIPAITGLAEDPVEEWLPLLLVWGPSMLPSINPSDKNT